LGLLRFRFAKLAKVLCHDKTRGCIKQPQLLSTCNHFNKVSKSFSTSASCRRGACIHVYTYIMEESGLMNQCEFISNPSKGYHERTFRTKSTRIDFRMMQPNPRQEPDPQLDHKKMQCTLEHPQTDILPENSLHLSGRSN